MRCPVHGLAHDRTATFSQVLLQPLLDAAATNVTVAEIVIACQASINQRHGMQAAFAAAAPCACKFNITAIGATSAASENVKGT